MNYKAILGAAMALVLAGCTETAGTRITIDTATGDASVMECSTRLRNRLRVAKCTYSDVDGIAKATVTIESLTHSRQELQARIVWLDDDGSEIDADAKPFRAIVLDGRDFTTISGMAPSPKGRTAKVQVRETETAQ